MSAPPTVEVPDAAPARRPIRFRKLRRLVIAAGAVTAIVLGVQEFSAWRASLPGGDTLRVMLATPHAVATKDARGKTVLRCHCPLPVTYDGLPKHLVDAVIAIEDRRFRDHPGVDLRGLARAGQAFVSNGFRVTQGGSSIEQQLAKLKLLDARDKWSRKPAELMLALRIARTLGKDATIAAYLNNAWFAENVVGVEAASRHFFGKRVSDIDVVEAATLAGMLQAPHTFNPQRNPEAAEARAKLVLAQMVNQGKLTDKRMAAALRAKRVVGKEDLDFDPRWYLDAVRDELAARQVPLAKGRPTRLFLALDTWQQMWAQQRLARSGDAYLGATVAMERDGRIRALVGGGDFEKSQFNNATRGERQVASLAKVLVLATAIENGWKLSDRIDDKPLPSGEPRNADGRYRGSVTLREAFAGSLNAAMVQLLRTVGTDKVLELAKRIGIDEKIPADIGVALGTFDLPLVQVTAIMATFANDGVKVVPRTILAAADHGGRRVALAAEPRARIVSKATAAQVAAALGGVVQNGTGREARLAGLQVLGKTGTSQLGRDGWFIGFSRNGIVSGHWAGVGPGTLRASVSGPREAARDFRSFHKQILDAKAEAKTEANKKRRSPPKLERRRDRRGPAVAELPAGAVPRTLAR